MAAKKTIRTFAEEFNSAAEKIGEATVREHLERLRLTAGAANRSAWELASLAHKVKEEFGFSLENLSEYVKPYSASRLSEYVRTYEVFLGTEVPNDACFDLANVARKTYNGLHGEAKLQQSPESVLRSFVARNLTSRQARVELAEMMRQRNLERSTKKAEQVKDENPGLLDTCHNKDCRLVLADQPENSVKLLLGDPPYLGYERLGIKTYTTGHEGLSGLEADADSLDPEDALELYCDLIKAAPRVLAENGVLALFLSATMHTDLPAFRAIMNAIESSGLRIAHELHWVKNKMPPKNFAYPFSTQTEVIWLLCRKNEAVLDCYNNSAGAPKYLPKQTALRSNLIYCDTETGRYLAARRSGKHHNLVVHQFEKPVELGMFLIEKLTLPGELVLDACGCHANLTLAAMRLKRHFIFCESHPERFAEGLRRIHEEQSKDQNLPSEPAPDEVCYQEMPADGDINSVEVSAGEAVDVELAFG
jgi:DNA modification methylase